MIFKPSDSIKIFLPPEQARQLSPREKIHAECRKEDTFAFDIYADDMLVGFVMLKQFEEGGYFLWNFAIDSRFQNKRYGTQALRELIAWLKAEHALHTMTTTYRYGNETAKRLYEKIGFVEVDTFCDGDYHEVNMIYRC